MSLYCLKHYSCPGSPTSMRDAKSQSGDSARVPGRRRAGASLCRLNAPALLALDERQQSSKRAAAMAVGELCFQVDLCHALAQFGQVEQWIVAEAAGAARSFQNRSFDCAIGDLAPPRHRAQRRGCNGSGPCAAWPGMPSSFCSRSMLFQTSVLSLASGESTRPDRRQPCRAHARRTAERIHFKAGIVGNNQFAGSEARVVDRLGGRIGEKGVAVFFRSRNVFDAGEGLNVYRMSLCGGAEIAELAGARSGGVEAKSHAASVMGRPPRRSHAPASKRLLM